MRFVAAIPLPAAAKSSAVQAVNYVEHHLLGDVGSICYQSHKNVYRPSLNLRSWRNKQADKQGSKQTEDTSSIKSERRKSI